MMRHQPNRAIGPRRIGMKRLIILIGMSLFSLASFGAQSATQGHFDQFVGRYTIVEKTCEAYEELCKQMEEIEIQYKESSGQPIAYITLSRPGFSVGYPLQAYESRSAITENFGVWSTVEVVDASAVLTTETRMVPEQPTEIDAKLLRLGDQAGGVEFFHTVSFIGKDEWTGKYVNRILRSKYRLQKKN